MKLTLAGKRNETTNIWSFQFEPQEPVVWQAGQSIRLEIPRASWGYSERRFTISSAPHEDCLQITTRISTSEFKQSLAALAIGDTIDGYNIEGAIRWGDPNQPKLFIAGGTGITLFRVALAQAYYSRQDPPVTLFYSAKDSPLLFEQELRSWQTAQQNFIMHTKPRRFTADEIVASAPLAHDSLIHIAGPQTMVDDIQRQLRQAGLTEAQLHNHFLS